MNVNNRYGSNIEQSESCEALSNNDRSFGSGYTGRSNKSFQRMFSPRSFMSPISKGPPRIKINESKTIEHINNHKSRLKSTARLIKKQAELSGNESKLKKLQIKIPGKGTLQNVNFETPQDTPKSLSSIGSMICSEDYKGINEVRNNVFTVGKCVMEEIKLSPRRMKSRTTLHTPTLLQPFTRRVQL